MLRNPGYSKYMEHDAVLVPIPEIGWDFQIEFTSVEKELKMIRESAGFVDYSFNNIIAVMGREATAFLQKILVNDVSKIKPGRILYSPVVDDEGSMVDEVTVFCLKEDYYLYNGGIVKDRANEWLAQKAVDFDVYLAHTGHCLMSVQGPKSRDILKNHIDIEGMQYYDLRETRFKDIPVIVGRLGYTGELGYELYCHYEQISNLWDNLLEIGKEYGMGPYGMGATDILSIEKGYMHPLDFYEGASPLELGLGWTVAFDKGDFYGRDALLKRKEEGLKTKLIGFEATDPDFPLDHFLPVFKNNEKVGEVTHFGPGLSVGKSFLGRAWVNIDLANEGEEIEIENEGKRTTVKVTLQKDWYDPGNKKVKA
jgi:aminomethyltransferase